MSSEYRNFLELSYEELEELNLAAKDQRKKRVAADVIQEERVKYLTDEKTIKAVTVVFSDLEGRLHMLDYDKKFLVKSFDNLTFDGSSIRGFTAQKESDLRLAIDWSAFYWTPADVFGAGKVIVFGEVIDKNGSHYSGDIRGVLKNFANEMYDANGWTLNAANEIEGFLFDGVDAERTFHETGSFEYVNKGGYYHSLPGDPLREFIDTTAEVQRAMGFENEKDHPEVAPSQFEINYTYGDVVTAADQIQLYKLICRQVATQMGMTASFLPKPVTGVNGSGMHTNVSITKGGKNLIWDPNGEEKTSAFGWEFVDRILTHGSDTCLLFNASVNAYRRLDPHFEAPNQIKASATDRGSMVRIPIGNEKSARIEVRSVGPDANPYLVLYSTFKTGLHGETAKIANLRQANRYLPDNIYTAIEDFRKAPWIKTMLGEDVAGRYADLKQASADRCPRLLGTIVKAPEVQFHHDVYNQLLWGPVLGALQRMHSPRLISRGVLLLVGNAKIMNDNEVARRDEAKLILRALLQGADPKTGRALHRSEVVHRPEVMRALLLGLEALTGDHDDKPRSVKPERKRSEPKTKGPERAGQWWAATKTRSCVICLGSAVH